MNESIQPGAIFLNRLSKHPVESKALTLFADYLDNSATEVELLRLNLRKIANKTGLELRQVLDLTVLAVLEGLLDLQWIVYCPRCKAQLDVFHTLQEVYLHDQTCFLCQTPVSPEAGRTFNVIFSLNPNIKTLNLPAFVTYREDGTKFESEEEYVKAITPEQFQLVLDTERLSREYPPISALELMHNEFFHQFFKKQTLPVDVSLKIARLSLLFTDLRGSTSMYAALGDAKAYELVRNHFDILIEETVRYNGVVIKTMGDAIMASFQKAEEALTAALNYQLAIESFNQKNELTNTNSCLGLKVGLASGPCLAVNQNGILDYFGTTVNIGSRLQDFSKGNDVVVTHQLLEEVGAEKVDELLKQLHFKRIEQGNLNLRGLPFEVNVTRLERLQA